MQPTRGDTLLRMKPDLYTKAVLTVIALLLLLIACNQYVHPATTANAQGPFAGVQYSNLEFFDTRTGDLWVYEATPKELVVKIHAKLSKLGENGTRTHFTR
jgi:hypothetical protein